MMSDDPRDLMRRTDSTKHKTAADAHGLESRLRSYVAPDDDSEDRAEIRALMKEAANALATSRAALTEALDEWEGIGVGPRGLSRAQELRKLTTGPTTDVVSLGVVDGVLTIGEPAAPSLADREQAVDSADAAIRARIREILSIRFCPSDDMLTAIIDAVRGPDRRIPVPRQESPEHIAPGLYRLHWTSGGFSLAAVGVLNNGTRWFAPVNWISGISTQWGAVDRAERIEAGPTSNEE